MSNHSFRRTRAYRVYDAFGALVGIYKSHSRALRVAATQRFFTVAR